MPLSTQRLVRNQVIFREVNERLRDLAAAAPDGHTDYLCECTDVSCIVKIELELSEYEAVRARPKTFFIVPGHEHVAVDRVVDRYERYTTVEKIVPLDDAATRALTTTDENWATDER